ncbi:hypothetical protein [Kordia antarctica]|uniref:hypothetical protein n=1 Tax=Kordia antarctica TaxID=1218801 RepID=UPI00135A4F77|nr:hypothetical protein [Kordia antarctica]
MDRELSKHIEEKEIQYVNKYLKYAQKLSVQKFNELPPTARISNYITGLVLDFQKLVDYTDQRLNGSLHQAKGGSDIANMKAEALELDRKIDETQDALNILNARFDSEAKQYKSTIKRWKMVLWILYFLAGFEILANMEIYNMLGGGIVASISIAVISGIVVFYWAHLSNKCIRQFGKGNLKKQSLAGCLMAIPIFVIFYLFSSMRVDYLLALFPNMERIYSGSPIVPTLINFFAYLIATYLVYEYRPSVAVKNAYGKYQADVKSIENLEQKRYAYIAEKNTLEPKLRLRLLDYHNLLLLGKQKEQDITTRMLACFHEFKSELHLLSNGKCAFLFSTDEEDLPPLKLNYQTMNENTYLS